MRYIGNKTRLLGFIRDTLRARGIAGGHAIDPFTGTASVARALKRWGFGVTAADLMQYAWIFGRAYVEIPRTPSFDGLAGIVRPARVRLGDVVAFLNRLEPRPGFMSAHFAPRGDAGRMYFTHENAGRIDAIREEIETWRRAGRIDDDAGHLLLALLIEAADAVANTTGVYAAYVKSWQPNALRPLRLRAPRLVPGNGCHAYRKDALEVVSDAGDFDLLYLDPPYNERQYPGYYHIPELIALGWFDGPVELRGRTGLIPDSDKRSDWARRGRCERAFEELVAAARCTHIVMSYNTEGIIREQTIERVLRDWARPGGYRPYTRAYRRYRSDSDGENRRYRGDEVGERLYCASR